MVYYWRLARFIIFLKRHHIMMPALVSPKGNAIHTPTSP